jgi:adenylylsulfate reductase subunit B
MPSYVIAEKCDGCKALERTACQHECPNNLMVLDKELMKAYNREPESCWECYSCVKICPVQAIAVRGYADFVPMGASVTPLRGTDSIMWTVKFRDGSLKRFKYANRTVPEGAIEPYKEIAGAKMEDLKNPLLAGEPEKIGVDRLAVPKNKSGGL